MYIKYEPGQKYAKKGAEIAESPDLFDDCGYVLEDDDVIIDIDELPKETIQKVIDEFGINTQIVWTDRGAHLYFKKPLSFNRAKNGSCALGFPIETKHQKNCKSITIKRNGVLREIENAGMRMELPWFFSYNKKFQDLSGLENGEGRNNMLFSHKAMLDNHEDTTKILRFINTTLFTEPLDEDEFQHICRQYDSTNENGGKEYAVANDIIKQLKCVIYQGAVWCFDGKRFFADGGDDSRLKKIIYDRCPGKNTRFVDEVVKQIYYRAPRYEVDAYPIKLRNGIITEGSFVSVENYMEFTPYYIDIDYKADAKPVQEVDDYINAITDNDADYRKLLLEAMGYAFITDPNMIRSIGQFFILRGDGANGKGTLLQIMRRIYGPENCSALSIKELTDTRYQVNMIGRLANLGDDVEPEAINNKEMKALKNMATADTIETRYLYKQSFNATFTAKLFFTTNADLRTFEKGYAYKRRVKWLPMFNKVEYPDPRFISKMTTSAALDYWIKLLVEAYSRLYQNGRLTECKVVEDYNSQYHVENNYMQVFLETLDIETDIIGKTGLEIKDLYREYNDDDSKKYSPKLLAEALREHNIGKGIKKINGKTYKVYMRQDDTTQKVL